MLGVSFFSTEVRHPLSKMRTIMAMTKRVKFMYMVTSGLPIASRLIFIVTTINSAKIKVQSDHVKN